MLVLLVFCWMILDRYYLFTEQLSGHRSFATINELTEQIIIQTNLEFCISNLAGPIVGERNVYRGQNLSNAARLIVKRFSDYGYSNPQISLNGFPVPQGYKFSASNIAGYATNIIVEKKGVSLPQEIILIGAHYDTIGFSMDWTGTDVKSFRPNEPGTPGANDNASGVAALLEIARLLRNSALTRTVRFVAFANEEPPFFQQKSAMGSYIYAQQCRAKGENIAMMVSLDTLGVYSRLDRNSKRAWPASWFLSLLGLATDTNYVAFMSNWDANSGSKATAWAKVFSTNSTMPVRTVSLPFIPQFGTEIFAWSDDWSFTRESYPAFTVTDTAFYRSDRYHELYDNTKNMTKHDYEALTQVVIGLSKTTAIMSNDRNQPKNTRASLVKYIRLGAAFAVLILIETSLLCGCTSVGKPMRFDPDKPLSSGKTPAKQDAWYVEGEDDKGRLYSCSFVEFDGRGDYLDFKQHTAAWAKVKQLASNQKVLLVFYCHGWKNNSQSGDVVEFNEFLGRLSSSDDVGGFGYRVHGIYLGWRGNLYLPFVDKGSPTGAYQTTKQQFGEPIINESHQRRFLWTALFPELVSYWGRRIAAEHKVSSVPIARTIYTCASLTKAIDKLKSREGLTNSSRVMVMGHSFGALLLERALNATCLDPLTDQWGWFARQAENEKADEEQGSLPLDKRFTANPLPLDFVLLINSAAPAIYTKTMRDFLADHHSAAKKSGSPYADAPVFISLTSSADWATGCIHPIANVFAPLYPSLQRTYTDLLKVPKGEVRPIRQSVFYNRTAGHQPLLIDHWLIEDSITPKEQMTHEKVFDENLDYSTTDPLRFLAIPATAAKQAVGWKLSLHPASKSERKWANRFGRLDPVRSSYWLVRCDKRLIRGHNDVWSDSAMETYAALYRLVEWARIPANTKNAKEVFDDYWK